MRAPAARGPLLGRLPEFLFRSDRHKLAYVLQAWLLALVPSIALSSLLAATTTTLGAEVRGPDIEVHTPVLLAALVFIGPLLESIVMGGALLLLDRWFGASRAVLASAVLWGLLHSAVSPLWGLVVWWPFLIFSIVFLTWRGSGFWLGVAMATAVHGLQNGAAGAALLAGLG